MSAKKKRYSDPLSGDIPAGLSSRDFLNYYHANRSKFDSGSVPGKDAAGGESAAPVKKKRGRGDVGSEPGDRGRTAGLRIIGGRFKGLRLEYGGDHRVRPMKDRIRESVFNLMGIYAPGRHVIDLFAGTGALAFEAISRGAESATLIEIHFPSARIIRRNIAVLAEKNPQIPEKIDLTITDVFFWGKELAEHNRAKERGESVSTSHLRHPLPSDRPWLVFCSPPYDFYVSRQNEMLELLAELRAAAPAESIFVIEADRRFDFGLLGVEIPEKKRRSYPPAEIGIFMTGRREPNESESL